jgi:hypothetical protein
VIAQAHQGIIGGNNPDDKEQENHSGDDEKDNTGIIHEKTSSDLQIVLYVPA